MTSFHREWDIEADRVDVARRLGFIEEALGLASADVALVLGVPPATYDAWKTGHERLPSGAALTLKKNFGCALDWLYVGDPTHNACEFQARIGTGESRSHTR